MTSVYFIRAGRYFKIGSTDNVRQRFANLHRSSTRYTFPAGVSLDVADRELYRTVRGELNAEHAIHAALADFSVGLEWFLDEPPVRAFIDALPAGSTWITPAKVDRPGGPCVAEYEAVQEGRADREWARFLAKRAS